MRSEYFDLFIQDVGDVFLPRTAEPSVIEAMAGRLPNALLDLWREEGWSGYADGLFWIVNPQDYAETVADWLGETPFAQKDRLHVIARTAFGKLYVWGERFNQSLTLNCATGVITALEKEWAKPESDPDMAIGVFFASKTRRDLDIKKGLFDEALARLGPVGPDEMYGFSPPLLDGGEMAAHRLRKVEITQHLKELRALQTPTANPYNRIQLNQP